VGRVELLANGNYVVATGHWNSPQQTELGAVTFASGTIGLNGPIGPTNSLVGQSYFDQIGGIGNGGIRNGGITPFANGNYVVWSSTFDNGGLGDAGAVIFASGSTGAHGTVMNSNAKVGAVANAGLQPVVPDDVNGNFYAPFSGENIVRVGSQIDGFALQWHLKAKPPDVTADGVVAADDAMAIINYINAKKPDKVSTLEFLGQPYGYLDVTGDDVVAADDVITCVNYINAHPGEQNSPPAGDDEPAEPTSQWAASSDASSDALLLMLAADTAPNRRK